MLVSTDIGGTDPDDYQSMAHLLLYADVLELEGLVSSPYGPGRKEHILQVIDCYARDYANLRSHAASYPAPEALRAMTKEGALDATGPRGVATPTEGSHWIVQCARRPDSRPLWVLVWGGIEDLAQALHDAPDIEPKLRVYFIGGPNKKWSVDAYHYIERHHPNLWLIESNATYRGWFVGGNQAGEWGNKEFVTRHVAGHGALGEYFAGHLGGVIKMGDTPAVVYLLHGTPEDPTRENWGGRFVRTWERPPLIIDRLPTASDRVEQFGVFEFGVPLPAEARKGITPTAEVVIENQALPGFVDERGAMRFRFSPKDAKTWTYTVRSNVAVLEGKAGSFVSYRIPADAASRPSTRLRQWWTDDPAEAFAEGPHVGAKTVSRWREEFLADFAARMRRCRAPKS